MKRNKREKNEESVQLSNAVSADIFSKRRQYKRKRKLKNIGIICTFSLIVLAIALFIIVFMQNAVIRSLTVEAGCEKVSAADFFEKDAPNSAFVSGGDFDTHIPGEYDIKVRNGALIYAVKLTVVDTVAPKAKKKNIQMTKGERELQPTDFVTDIIDESEVDVSFAEPFDCSQLGDREVTVVLTDMGGNVTEYKCKLTVFHENLIPSLTVEAGSRQLTVKDFFKKGTVAVDGDAILTDIGSIPMNKLGSYELEISFRGTVYTVRLNVVDTKAPAGYIINQTAYKGNPIPASDFIRTVYDETQVKISYKEEPDFTTVGDKLITLVLVDEAGNTREYAATLYVRRDKTPPVINASNRVVYLGDNIRFSDGVSVKDNCDGDVEFTVDASKFKHGEAGEYPVTFKAEDSSGNKAEKTVTFVLKKKPKEYTYSQQYIDAEFNLLYSRIITEDMTTKQKMRAIYDYIRENISYTGTSDKSSDWEQEAYRAYRSKGGDSWSFYALARRLLTMAGIKNKPMERLGGDNFHYWNLVEYKGEWYHFDTCPHYKDYPIDSFMLTEEQIKEYSEKTGGYYDHADMPETTPKTEE